MRRISSPVAGMKAPYVFSGAPAESEAAAAARVNYSLLNMRADLAKEDNRSMLRDPSLIQLSRQHHNALALCVRLERALQAASVDLGAWQLEVHQHYANEVQFHFAADTSDYGSILSTPGRAR